MWTKEQVVDELPKIRRLKGVEAAYVEGECLYVRTAPTLKHPALTALLPQLELYIPITEEALEGRYGYKYRGTNRMVDHFWWETYPVLHPVLELNDRYYQVPCVGDNMEDYAKARTQGPYMTVIQQLAMLQTITGDKMRRAEGGIEIFWPGIVFSVFVVAIVALFTTLIISAFTHKP